MKRFANRFDLVDEERHSALEQLLLLLRTLPSDDPRVSPRVRAWAIEGLAALLARPGLTVDEALGFRPRRGKHRFHDAYKRERIRELASTFTGTALERAHSTAAVLRGELAPPCVKAQSIVDQLRPLGRLPGSARRILTVIQQVKPHRDVSSPGGAPRTKDPA